MPDLQFHVELLSPPPVVYRGWLDSYIHGAISEAMAAINPVVNGEYRLWSGTVQGRFLELDPNKKIVQTWRTAEFALNMESSVVTLLFQERKQGTRLVVQHEKIPVVFEEQFRFGWEDYYFPRLKRFFIAH